jgi:DNA-binding CsgD family transcriptional regulator
MPKKFSLTKREAERIRELARLGLPHTVIAIRFGISPTTVGTYVKQQGGRP